MVYRNPNVLYPESVLEGVGPRFGEYPVPLMTRRTWGLRADDVINRRGSAPNPIWCDPRSFPDVRPNE